jgi:hypothetical protein
MVADTPSLLQLMHVIAAGEDEKALQMLGSAPSLTTAALDEGASRGQATEFFFSDIGHYAYAGDTALHIAAAAHQVGVLRALIPAGADVDARNRRGASPLHYAADSRPGGARWSPQEQAAAITYLISVGADPNATDGSKVRPLHRAVRTRGAAAVRALLAGGADPSLPNKNGSTALQMATRTTGRSGSGTADAKVQQAEIFQILQAHRVR